VACTTGLFLMNVRGLYNRSLLNTEPPLFKCWCIKSWYLFLSSKYIRQVCIFEFAHHTRFHIIRSRSIT